MLTFEESRRELTALADGLPRGIFRELNGGIVLLPDTVWDDHGLLILGEYHTDPYGLGRYITIYYGSLQEAFHGLPPAAFRDELRDVLYHELTHHVEDLAGDNLLDIQDELDIKGYLDDEW
ncbi:MAG: metallopeptidase family protein [Defluviitaleaceae bacterium]|nr:metallopeptidase family protein [Defluviitaleaceae bacterium]